MGRFLSAIWRFVTFGFLRSSEDVRRAADEKFTGSTGGIRAAFAIERDAVARDFRNLQEAVAGVLNVVEERKAELVHLNEEEKLKIQQIEGALAAAEQAQADGNNEAFERAKAAHVRFSQRVTEIDARQEALSAQITQLETSMTTHMSRLTDLKARLERLPQEEAESISEFVSARTITDLNNRLMNAGDSLHDSPVAAVKEKVRSMSAQARITEKLAGTDAKLQDHEYERLGRESSSGTNFEALLAARKAQRDGVKTEEAPVAETPVQSERPRV